MSELDIEKLLGGFAADTLTAEKKQTLYTATLIDQQLCNAFADKQALKSGCRCFPCNIFSHNITLFFDGGMTPDPHNPIPTNRALPDSAWFTGTASPAFRQPENKVAWGFVESVNNKIRVIPPRSGGATA